MQGVCLWDYYLVIKTSVRASGMRYEDKFFAEIHPQIAQVIGAATGREARAVKRGSDGDDSGVVAGRPGRSGCRVGY